MDARTPATSEDWKPLLRSASDRAQVHPFPLALNRLRRILVVKLDHVGDWVLVTPFLRNLRTHAPRAVIDVIVREEVLDLAAACSELDRAVAVKSDGLVFRGVSRADTTAFKRDYEAGRFDLALVPRWDVDFDGAGKIATRSQAPVVVGFSEICTERKRTLNRGYDRFYTHVLEDTRLVHEVEHNLSLITAMGGAILDRRVATETSEEDAARAAQILSPLRGLAPRLAIAPFATEPKRCIPLAETEELAAPLLDELFASAVVIGGPSDREAGAYLARRLGATAISVAGRCSIREAAEIIRRCDAMIAADSGPAHLAAAVGTPVAVLSCHPHRGLPGHENSPLRFAPWGSRGRTLVLQPETAVSPCRYGCEASVPHCILETIQGARLKLDRFLRQAVLQDRPSWQAASEPDQFPAG